MKKLNYFFDKANLLLVYLVMSAVVFIMAVGTFYFLGEYVGSSLGKNVIILLKVSGAMGAIMGIPTTCMVYLSRKSAEFWAESKVVGEKIDKAETDLELSKIWDTDLKALSRKASGTPHYYEVRRLKTIIETKAKYVK